ncbi:carbohydrate ABC transporter permease [Nonomuraea gerenzanensis]|uniref:carbohydrate ABC transporter permease n=1 Tax=Nonomuraea gerenzanensis TaxID=93944 RepID=UPI001CDA2AFF|nr:carbohydrate ABC transporter permease [Nonomuraea gerenzanensis]UBU16587.1 carbohydrate ABC transporter permease [Nonomuraea gerenzanensis]
MSRPRTWPAHVVLAGGALVMIAPFAWQVVVSLQTLPESLSVPPKFTPSWQWSNFPEIFRTVPLGRQFLNTVVVTAAVTAGQLLLCSLAAFAFARLRFPGRGAVFMLFLAVLMVPGELFLIPRYEIMVGLGWLNTLQALIAPGVFGAFGTFLLRQFFLTLPRELDEAAQLEGANPLQIYWHIMLPLVRPGLLALGMLTVMWSWSSLLWPLVVNTDPEMMTLSAGLASLRGQFQTNFPMLFAGSVVATLPVIVLFVIMQKQLIAGIAFTGSKG